MINLVSLDFARYGVQGRVDVDGAGRHAGCRWAVDEAFGVARVSVGEDEAAGSGELLDVAVVDGGRGEEGG